MTLIRPPQYIQHPWATESEWTTRNPLLKNGEEGYAVSVVNSITHVRKKVGPGYWNDLPWHDGVVWEDTNSVSNPIGDASGNLAGLTPKEILNKMLNPYAAPVISGVTNNAGGSTYSNIKVIEIGNTITNPVIVRYSISNPSNLSGVNPITVSAGGNFTNEGTFPVGDITLSHDPFNPIGLNTISIGLRATHIKGITSQVYTYLTFYPKLIWVVSQTKNLTGSAIMALPNKTLHVTNDYTRDYIFPSAGYAVFCIPVMLNPNPTFTDITNPNLPAGFGVDDLGIMSINNGVGTYNYQVYASKYYLLNPTTVKIS